MSEQYGDPFLGRRAKPAVRSEGVMGGFGGIVSTGIMAYASYQANGQLSEAEIVALLSAVVSMAIAIKGRLKAKQAIGSWF